MQPFEILAFVAFGLVAIFIITIMFRDWFRTRRIKSALTNRDQNDDDQFRKFYPDPKRADIAVRTRRVLAKNLELALDGVTPTDRLNDDLNAELPANPDLFWELETEFGMKTDVEDLDAHEKSLERLVTFQDLVEYVERKIAEPRPQTPSADENERPSRTYNLAIRSIPVLCVGGFITAVVAILIQKRSLMNLGGLMFLSGIAVWGLANGGEILRSMFKSLRGSSWKEIAARPWPLIVFSFIAVFFLWIGGTLALGILKNLLSSK